MDRICSMHRGEEECISCSGGKARIRNHQEEIDVGGRVTLKLILEKY
jgi:hypothetical protein